MKNKLSYSELVRFNTFEERFKYLKLDGELFGKTFGSYRYENQKFYMSYEWRKFRRDIILRDGGCDLGLPGFPIAGKIIIHHLNPITLDDILNRSDLLMNPENVICVQKETHNAIHFGGEQSPLTEEFCERKPYDTCPWR